MRLMQKSLSLTLVIQLLISVAAVSLDSQVSLSLISQLHRNLSFLRLRQTAYVARPSYGLDRIILL